jgi:hypothetical protein
MASDLTWEECNEWLSELMDHYDDMDAWEQGFMDNLVEYEDQGKLYSESQKDKIEEMHDKYC